MDYNYNPSFFLDILLIKKFAIYYKKVRAIHIRVLRNYK